jgi:hypothetical protein
MNENMIRVVNCFLPSARFYYDGLRNLDKRAPHGRRPRVPREAHFEIPDYNAEYELLISEGARHAESISQETLVVEASKAVANRRL